MNKPTNLNKHRKQKARTEKKAQAAENAVKFGLTKAERLKTALDAQKADTHLDNHKRDR